jgi:3'-5' exoribonuclease
MIAKKQPVSSLKKDDIVNDIFVVKFKKPVEQYKNGYKFELRLGDSSKEIMYKYWGSDDEDAVKSLYDSINKDDVVLAQGRVNEWNSKLEISANEQHSLKSLKKGEYDIMDFVKKTQRDISAMWTELLGVVDSVNDSDMKKILEYFFKDEKFASEFKQSPAAMYIHHGWIGGLLEHTLDVARLCDAACTIHPALDRNLAITGALLHDIGKLKEFSVKTSINVTKGGMLVGHVTMGSEMLSKAMDRLGTPEELKFKLIHLILTHMGEYGSSKTPSLPEALLVFFADNMNARITQMTKLKEEASTEDEFIYHKDFGNIYLR